VIGVVDYGLGNVRAFENIYRRLGIEAAPVRTAEELERADRLILPGVGAFDWAMARLTQSGMIDTLNQRVLQDEVPVLGVCVGMQIMANGSDEGKEAGLGWIPGRVERFRDEWFNTHTHLPHMGWNDVELVDANALMTGLVKPTFYFLHSYFFRPVDENYVIARTRYGKVFASAIQRGNIWATQFHPEKSHDWGVGLLANFAKV
jgi:glutamine amidotransferase